MNKELKKKKFPSSVVFVVGVMIFAAWTYFSEFKGAEKRDAEKEKSLAILSGKSDELVEISLKDLTKPAPQNEVLAKRESPQAEWKLDKPFTDLGDSTAFEMLLSGLQTQKIKEVVVEAKSAEQAGAQAIDWKTFGLDSPQVEANFTYKSADPANSVETKRKIIIGSVPAFDGSVYLRIGDENRVLLADSTVEALFKRDARSLRDKRILPIAKLPEFRKLALTIRGQTSSYEKQDGRWKLISEPPSAYRGLEWPLDNAKVQDLLNELATMRAQDIWAEDKSERIVIVGRKLDRPGIVATLTSQESEGQPAQNFEIKIASLAKEESVTAAVGSLRPVVFSVNRTQVDAVSKTLEDLLDLSFPFQFDEKVVSSIQIERPVSRGAIPPLRSNSGKWEIDLKDESLGGKKLADKFSGREVSQESVEKFFSELKRIRAMRIAPKSIAVPGLGKKADSQGFRVKLRDQSGRVLNELLFAEGGVGALGQFVSTSSRTPGVALLVEKSFVDAIPMELLKPENSASLATKAPAPDSGPSAPNQKGTP